MSVSHAQRQPLVHRYEAIPSQEPGPEPVPMPPVTDDPLPPTTPGTLPPTVEPPSPPFVPDLPPTQVEPPLPPTVPGVV